MNDNPAFLAFLQEEEARSYDGTLLDEVEAAINSYNGADPMATKRTGARRLSHAMSPRPRIT
jgi:hypothetical protein